MECNTFYKSDFGRQNFSFCNETLLIADQKDKGNKKEALQP